MGGEGGNRAAKGVKKVGVWGGGEEVCGCVGREGGEGKWLPGRDMVVKMYPKRILPTCDGKVRMME